MTDWIDLTHPLNAETWIYREAGYSDPAFSAERWCDVDNQRYEVWKLGLGTQMGTHIDAPCHFAKGGATMDAFGPQDAIGTYRLVTDIDLARDNWTLGWQGESHLLLDARSQSRVLPRSIETLLSLPVKTIVMAGELKLDHPDPLWFHVRLGQTGKFLVEDLNVPSGFAFPATGQIATVPLPLSGLSGSPTRVLIAST